MTFKVLDNRNRTELEQKNFATISAIYGKQFGREVYSSVIQFKDLAEFLEIFPEVQRDIIPRKVASLRRYILSGVSGNNEDIKLRFFSAVTVTCKGHMFYDGTNKRLAIDTHGSKLSINDGQHRVEAIKSALEYLDKEFGKSKDKMKTAKIMNMINELSEMTIPVVIFNGLSELEEKQLFHDLNDLAQRPSRNAKIRLNQTDLISRLAREIASTNRYLIHYGVEYDKMGIHKNNPNTVLLTSLHASIKTLFDYEFKNNKNFLTEENYDQFRKIALETYDQLFFHLPPDLNTKGKYVLDKSYALKAITRFISHMRHNIFDIKDEVIYKIIADMSWTTDLENWEAYDGFIANNGKLMFAGSYDVGGKAIYDRLTDIMNKYLEENK